MELKIGDWVRSYSPGIWRIYRILKDYKHADPLTGKEAFRTTIFSKRFLSRSFKRFFGEQSCDPSFVSKLGSDDQKRLEAFIAKNPAVYEKFETYQPKPVNCIYNARIGIPAKRSGKDLAAAFDSSRLIRETDIDSLLTGMGFDTRALPSWTVQFVSVDYQCIDDYIVFRFDRILEF